MMSSMRKIQRRVENAAAAYRSAAADAALAAVNEHLAGREPYESDEVQRLQRRAAAHRAQWFAAERTAEEAAARR